MLYHQMPQEIRDAPYEDYRDMLEILYETGGPDGKPLLERPTPDMDSGTATSAESVNQMRRTHAFA